MTIEWLRDVELPEDILRKMESAAGYCPKCEGINEPCSITVRLCDDETIEKINAEYRGIDSSTDVLSFPLLQNAYSQKEVLRLPASDALVSHAAL